MSDETNIPDDNSADGPGANREYKDGMFRAIFRKREEFLRVASYVMKTDFGPDTPMEEVTLSSPIYIDRRNDVSYLIDGRLIVFTEHQSALSPNLALRLLIYAADTYKTRYSAKSLHGRSLKIPRPYFFVFYNGTRNLPPEQKMRLSDMFTEWHGPENPPFSLDLEFTIYNININKAPEILHKCETLAQYETFVELMRGYERDHGRKQAIKLATAECMKRGILTEFLTIHGAELLYIMECRLTIEEMKEYWMEEAREDALEEGMAKGIVQTAKAMKTEGFDPETIAKITGLTIDDIRRL